MTIQERSTASAMQYYSGADLALVREFSDVKVLNRDTAGALCLSSKDIKMEMQKSEQCRQW